MKIVLSTSVLLLFFTVTNVQAATCRSSEAAIRGSEAGYELDKEAAEETAVRDRSASDIIGQCVGGITAVITAPQFPSLSEIFQKIMDQMCRVLSDQMHDAVGNANEQINITSTEIYGQTNSTGANEIAKAYPQTNAPAVQQTTNGSTQAGAFWSTIWQ